MQVTEKHQIMHKRHPYKKLYMKAQIPLESVNNYISELLRYIKNLIKIKKNTKHFSKNIKIFQV